MLGCLKVWLQRAIRAVMRGLLLPKARDFVKVLPCWQASTHTSLHWCSRSMWKLAASNQDMDKGGWLLPDGKTSFGDNNGEKEATSFMYGFAVFQFFS